MEMENSEKQRTTENRNYSYPSFNDDDGLLFQRRQQYLQKYAMRRSMRSLTFDKTSSRTSHRGFDSDSDIDPLSSEFNQRFSIYTRAALENAGKTCSNSSTVPVYKRSAGCIWVDHKGEQHEIPGPFWPKDHLPRFSCQKHIHFIPDFVERLNTEGMWDSLKWKNSTCMPNKSVCLPLGFPFRTDFSPCYNPHAVITSVNTHFSAYKEI